MNHGRNIAQFEKAKTAKKSKYINESRSGSSRRWWSDSYRIRRAKKKSPKMKKALQKIGELDSDNRVVDQDFSDESDTDETHSNIHRCSAVLSFVGFLRPTASICFLEFVSFFVLSILPDQLRWRKSELQKNHLSALNALRNTRDFFSKRLRVRGSKLSLHWLAKLTGNPVEGVYGQILFVKARDFS